MLFTIYASRYNKLIRYIAYIKREYDNEIRENRTIHRT